MNNGSVAVARKIGIYAGTFVAVATALGFVNKWFIADPITRAVAEERVARQEADREIINILRNLQFGQAQVLNEVETTGANAGDAVEAAERARRTLGSTLSGIDARLDTIEAKLPRRR